MKVKDLIKLLQNNCMLDDEIEIYKGCCHETGQDCYDEPELEEIEYSNRYDSESDTYIKTWQLV